MMFAGLPFAVYHVYAVPLGAAGSPFHAEGSMLARAIGTDGLFMLNIAMLLLAAAVTAAMLAARREARQATELAVMRGKALGGLLDTFKTTEEMAGIGVWQFDPASGAQSWSHGLRRIFGVHHSDPFVEGDAETLLYANNVDLIAQVRERLDERVSYDLHFEIFGFDGKPRAVSVQALNQRGEDGQVNRVVAVVRDVTAQIEHEQRLESSRIAAMAEADQARELAETDELTGLANRRRVMDRLDRLVMDARLDKAPLGLIVFDIDHFKQVNDTHGHLQGDKVLSKVARIATEQSRDGDLVGRIGGEEFVWIVPGAGEGMARILAERLRQAVSQQSATATVPAVTISAGFAELCAGDTSLSLFARADSALYEAKHAGRNRVRMAA